MVWAAAAELKIHLKVWKEKAAGCSVRELNCKIKPSYLLTNWEKLDGERDDATAELKTNLIFGPQQ